MDVRGEGPQHPWEKCLCWEQTESNTALKPPCHLFVGQTFVASPEGRTQHSAVIFFHQHLAKEGGERQDAGQNRYLLRSLALLLSAR